MNNGNIEKYNLHIFFVIVLIWSTIILILKYYIYENGGVRGDIYLYSNALTNTNTDGKILHNYLYFKLRGIDSLLLDHFQPSTILLKPLYELFGGVRFLIAFPVLAAATMAIAGYRVLCTLDLPYASWRFVIPAMFLFHPYFIQAVVDPTFGFHHDSQFLLYGTFLALSVQSSNLVLITLSSVLFLGVKENSSFILVALGVGIGLFSGIEKRKTIAMLCIALGAIWAGLSLYVIPNMFSGENVYASDGINRLSWEAVLLAMKGMLLEWGPIYLFSWASFFEPLYIIAALPDLLILNIFGKSPGTYYNHTIFVFAFFGFIYALRTKIFLWLLDKKRNLIKSVILIQVAVTVFAGLYEIHRIQKKASTWFFVPAIEVEQLLLSQIPKTCSVHVDTRLMRLFHDYPMVTFGPHPSKHVDFIVEVNDPDSRIYNEADLTAILSQGDYDATLLENRITLHAYKSSTCK